MGNGPPVPKAAGLPAPKAAPTPGPAVQSAGRVRPTPAQLRYVAGAARRQGLAVPQQVYEDREECSRWLDSHGDWNQ